MMDLLFTKLISTELYLLGTTLVVQASFHDDAIIADNTQNASDVAADAGPASLQRHAGSSHQSLLELSPVELAVAAAGGIWFITRSIRGLSRFDAPRSYLYGIAGYRYR